MPVHRELAKTQMKRDAEAVELVLKWFEEIKPFDNDRDKELLVSFSTRFTSTADDSVNAERAAEVGMEMQIKLDGQSVTFTMDEILHWVKFGTTCSQGGQRQE